MSTNYYIPTDPCPHCGKSDEPLHIGQSASGWCFALHVIPELGLTTLEAWREKLKDSRIQDEYGKAVSLEELLSVITDRKRDPPPPTKSSSWPFPEGLQGPYSIEGPNNLRRCRIDGAHCVGHGEGTWDYITGDYS